MISTTNHSLSTEEGRGGEQGPTLTFLISSIPVPSTCLRISLYCTIVKVLGDLYTSQFPMSSKTLYFNPLIPS